MRLKEDYLSYIWECGDTESEKLKEATKELRAICESSNTSLGMWLLGKIALRRVTNDGLKELELHLQQLHNEQNALQRVTQRVRKFLPGMPVAKIVIQHERDANPINPESFSSENLQQSAELLAALGRAYRSDLMQLSPRARVGLLLLSAAFSGGLLDIPQLSALVRITPADVIWISAIPEVRLRLGIRGKSQMEHRQWFPDPVTLALIFRCASDLDSIGSWIHKSKSKVICINELMRRAGYAGPALPDNLSEIIQLLQIQMYLRLPPLLVNYSARKRFSSQSIRPSAWGAIFGHQDFEDPPGVYDETSNLVSPVDEPDADGWLAHLLKEIRRGAAISAPPSGQEYGSVEALITGWVDFMTENLSSFGNKLQRATIANYVRAVGSTLDQQLDGLSIFQIEPDALETCYETAMESQAGDSARRNLAKGLREFQAYMERQFAYPQLSSYSVLRMNGQVACVDAHVISEDQYRRALIKLDSCGLELISPRLVAASRLMMILGFRLGLRRNEALKLRMSDLQVSWLPASEQEPIHERHQSMRRLSEKEILELDLPVDLLIRPHALRGLKTQNAVRRLPLRVLLEPDELDLLLEWFEQRKGEEKVHPFSDFLLCIPALRTLWISESVLMPALHRAMRDATGSDSTHYHHLRHSCATWMTLKLLAITGKGAPEFVFEGAPLTEAWLKNQDRLAEGYVHFSRGPTRKVAHIVSAILGHSKPKTSLWHYIHSLPIAMAGAWQWNPKNWQYAPLNLAEIAGVSLPTASRSAQELQDERQHALRILGRISTLKRTRRRPASCSKEMKHDPQYHWALERLREVESMLAYASYAEETGDIVNLNGAVFAADDRAMMIDRARYIRNLNHRSTKELSPSSIDGRKHRYRSSIHSDIGPKSSLVPMPPKHGGREAVSHYVRPLYDLFVGPEKQRAIRALDYFVEHCWATDTTLRFYRDRDEERARDYLWLLHAMGILATNIELVVYDVDHPKKVASYWRKVLGVARKQVSVHSPENPNTENSHIGIRATLMLDGGLNRHSGSALRYLFLLASIDWHFKE
ncbi:hypothetical protein [Halopseudomonas sp.]|uniref:hypothetical protein n=1 Tax=Halopseudomonas sp. TaxID=2901191 RepID=UPI00300128D9